MNQHPEIIALRQYFTNHKIEVSKSNSEIRKDLFFVKLSLDNHDYKILIDDEYNDFTEKKSLVNWYLILLTLETYKESNDFLSWCHELMIDTKITKYLEYYKSLEKTYYEIEQLIGTIDAQISSHDYSLSSCVVKELLSEKSVE